MILVFENKPIFESHSLGQEITQLIPNWTYYPFVDDTVRPLFDGVDGLILAGSSSHLYEKADAEWIQT